MTTALSITIEKLKKYFSFISKSFSFENKYFGIHMLLRIARKQNNHKKKTILSVCPFLQ